METFDDERRFNDLTNADIIRSMQEGESSPEQEAELTLRLGREGLRWAWSVEQDYKGKKIRDVVRVGLIEDPGNE